MSKKVNLPGLEIMDRDTLEQMANIIGESSAASMVLAESGKYRNPVFLRYRGALFVTEAENVRIDREIARNAVAAKARWKKGKK